MNCQKAVILTVTVLYLVAQPLYSQDSLLDAVINKASLEQLVGTLASDSFEGRFTGSFHAGKAAEFIANEFQNAGLLPVEGNEGYFMRFYGIGNSQVGINVVAALKGTTRPEEVVIFCAHYDHVGTRSTNPHPSFASGYVGRRGDTIYNGANDNASGTAAVIGLARYFGQIKNNERTILFIAFAGEELGLLGSKAMASVVTPTAITAVVNIEMIGRARSRKKRNPYITGSNLSNFQKLINKRLFEANPEHYGKKFFSDDNYSSQNLFQRSDNYWFAERGIPSHTILATSPTDKYYHSQGDETSTLDFDLMGNIVKAIAMGCTNLVNGVDTPTRITRTSLP